MVKQSLALADPIEAGLVDFPTTLPGTVVAITATSDIFTAREEGRVLAARLGFSAWDQTMIASSICELARNILEFAAGGWIALTPETLGHRVGLAIEAGDDGPGIADPASAVAGGGTPLKSPGFGLPGVTRLMDELAIVSELGKGTTVTAKKWCAPVAGRMTAVKPALARHAAEARCLTAP